jgi:hypothetical protein
MRDPRRLSEDPSASELARALQEAGELGSRERVASAWQRLEPALDRVPPAPIDASSGMSTLTKGALIAGTLALGTVGWLVLSPAKMGFQPASSATESAPTPVAATTPILSATPIANTLAPNTIVVPPSPTLAPEPEPLPGTAPVAPRPQARVPAAQRSKPALAAARPNAAVANAASAPDAEGELALLTRAQEQLEVAPAAALALLAEHEQRYASGVLVQERELLRIEAERALGRSDSAAARAQAFIARFPRSPQRARLQSWLSTRSQADVSAAEADKP